jgi:LysM repeat protein
MYLDGVALPVTPSKLEKKIENQNKTINLINEGEINILKDAGLTEITFEAAIPHVKYPYAIYSDGFKTADFYLDKFEQLKISKKPFQFICSRVSPGGKLLFDTNIKVSLEDYTIKEDASFGQELKVIIKLKQYKNYGTKLVNIKTQQQAAVQVASATVQKPRSAETAPKLKTYTVKQGDTLWAIAKKYLGNGNRYTEIYNLNKNKISNPNLIYPGQVLTLPS